MPRQAILLRGINLGAVNKVPMPALRDALTEAGMGPVKSYLQSGNVAVSSDLAPKQLAALVHALVLETFGVTAPIVIRSAKQMRAVIDHNPYPEPAAQDPKHYAVTFLSGKLEPKGHELIDGWRAKGESVAPSTAATEVYAWHPSGIHVSKLAGQLNEKKLGVATATARNWTSVLAILALLQADD